MAPAPGCKPAKSAAQALQSSKLPQEMYKRPKSVPKCTGNQARISTLHPSSPNTAQWHVPTSPHTAAVFGQGLSAPFVTVRTACCNSGRQATHRTRVTSTRKTNKPSRPSTSTAGSDVLRMLIDHSMKPGQSCMVPAQCQQHRRMHGD